MERPLTAKVALHLTVDRQWSASLPQPKIRANPRQSVFKSLFSAFSARLLDRRQHDLDSVAALEGVEGRLPLGDRQDRRDQRTELYLTGGHQV
jgi:hypothetical protein